MPTFELYFPLIPWDLQCAITVKGVFTVLAPITEVESRN